MLVLTIEEPAVRNFMNRLLREDIFDLFEVRGVELNALTHVEISGAVDRDRQSGEERPYLSWERLKPLVTEAIKHGGKPRTLRIIFSGSDAVNTTVHPNASALFLNMAYENGGVTFTTATAQKEFTLDKTLDALWEEYVQAFFKRSAITAQIVSTRND